MSCSGEGSLITRIDDIKALSGDEARQGRTVRVRGIVTARLTQQFIMQDGGEGIFVYTRLARESGLWRGDDAVFNRLRAGSEVEVTGVTRQGGFAPVLVPQTISLFGESLLPVAEPALPGRFFRGMDDCRRVEVQGIVQGYWQRQPFGLMLVLDSGPGRFMARLPMEALDSCPGWVEAEVKMRGVAMASFNTRGELLMPTIYLNTAADLEVVRPPRSTPFEAPKVSLRAINGYRYDFRRSYRQRVEGVVTYAERAPASFMDDAVRPFRLPAVAQELGRTFYLQEGAAGLRVQTRQPVELQPGDRVEVSGFVDRTRSISGLCEAEIRTLGHAPQPLPVRVSVEQIVEANANALIKGLIAEPGDYDGALITCEATLADALRMDNGDWLLRLKNSDVSFEATLRGARGLALPDLRAGSRLALTGIVLLEIWHPRVPAVATRPRVDLLLRSPDDVAVLRQPSWWTVPRLLGALAVLLSALLAGAVWVLLLHRRVKAATRRLAAEMRSRREAALEYATTLRERNRLAANLHDTLLQTLGGISYQLAACQKGHLKSEPQLEVAKRMVGHATEELRNSVWALRGLTVNGQPFDEALKAVVERACSGRAVAVDLRSDGLGDDVPQFVGGSLLLIIQEALLNAVKHASPRRVSIIVRRVGLRLEVEVLDDGKGFVVEEAQSARTGHFGLVVMRERAERLGGTFAVESRPGGGAAVRVSVSLKDYDSDVVDPDFAVLKGNDCETSNR